jgi:hypothetical protein
MKVDDYEALDGVSFIPEPSHNSYELLAEFDSLASAQQAREALLEAGLDDDEVDLAEVGEEVSTRWGLSGDDRGLMGAIGARLIWGTGAGALIGGLAGLIVGLIVAGDSENFGITVMAAALVGATIGVLLGGVAGVCHALTQEQFRAWKPLLDHPVVAVHADSPEELDRAEAVLRGRPTLTVTRV